MVYPITSQGYGLAPLNSSDESGAGGASLFFELTDLVEDSSEDPLHDLLLNVYVALIDFRDEKQDSFEKAKEALLVYIVTQAGREFDPQWSWKTLKPLLKYLPKNERRMDELMNRISQFLNRSDLETKSFSREMDQMKPFAKALIEAFLETPEIRAKLDSSLSRQIANEEHQGIDRSSDWSLASLGIALQRYLDATDENKEEEYLKEAQAWFLTYMIDLVGEEYQPKRTAEELRPRGDMPIEAQAPYSNLMEGVDQMFRKEEFPYLDLAEETDRLRQATRNLIDALLPLADALAPPPLKRSGGDEPPSPSRVTDRKRPYEQGVLRDPLNEWCVIL